MIPYGQLRKDSRIDLREAVPLPRPLTIYVEPTNKCNLSCDFCPQSLPDYVERAGYSEHMDIGLFARLMNEIQEMQIKSLKLYFFGEPLLHPQIGEIVRLAKTVCERVELTTNAYALTGKIARQLCIEGLDYLRVSVYDDDPRVMRNVLGLHSIRGFVDGSKPYICAKVFDKDQAQHLRDIGWEDFVDEIAVEGLHTIGSDLVQFGGATGPQIACAYPFYNLVVKSNGDVVPCCVAWEKSLVVGNVKTQTLAEIWAGEPLARIHRLHIEGRRGELAACAQCDTIYHSPDSLNGLSVEEYDRRRDAAI